MIPGDSRRDGRGLFVSWEIESNMEWNEFAALIEERLREFRLVAREPGSLRFSRVPEGDAYHVTVRRSPRGTRLAEVTFEARPF